MSEVNYYKLDDNNIAMTGYGDDNLVVITHNENLYYMVNYFADKHHSLASIKDIMKDNVRIGLPVDVVSNESVDWENTQKLNYDVRYHNDTAKYEVLLDENGNTVFEFDMYKDAIEKGKDIVTLPDLDFNEELPYRYFDLGRSFGEDFVLGLSDTKAFACPFRQLDEFKDAANDKGEKFSVKDILSTNNKEYVYMIESRKEFDEENDLTYLMNKELFLVEDYSNGKFVESFVDINNSEIYNIGTDVEKERKEIEALVKSLYNISDQAELDSFVDDAMSFNLETINHDNEYFYDLGIDKGNKFTNLKTGAEFEKKQMEFMLNSLSDTINKYDNRSNTDEVSIMCSDDVVVSLDGKSVTPFESLLTSKFVDENTINGQREISDSKLNEFEDKMHDLDEDLINNKDFGLKL